MKTAIFYVLMIGWLLCACLVDAKTCTQWTDPLDGSIVITCDDGTTTVIYKDLLNN